MLAQLLLFKIKFLPSKGFKFLAKINKLLKLLHRAILRLNNY